MSSISAAVPCYVELAACSLPGRHFLSLPQSLGTRLAGTLVVLPIVAAQSFADLYRGHSRRIFCGWPVWAAAFGVVPLAAFTLIFACFPFGTVGS